MAATIQEATADQKGKVEDEIVDVKVLPKRPLTTANPTQRPGIASENVTYSVNASNIEAELMIKEDTGDDDDQ